MTNTEICNAIHKLRIDRQDVIRELMRERDTEMYSKIIALQNQCTHGKYSHQDNGIGHFWKECVYCGVRVEYEED